MLYERLARTVASGRISHAWLLTGRQEQTLEQAVQLAKALLCHDLQADGQPCGRCSSCHKLNAGNHPDLQIIFPRGASVKIEQTRAMQYMANLESYEGGRRVAIIHQAHTMPAAAANSLLKILEEPREGLFLILTAPLGDSLLETILSRVVWLRLPENLQTDGDDVYLSAYMPELARERELRENMRDKCRRLFELLPGDGAKLLIFAKSFREEGQGGVGVKRLMAIFLEELLDFLREQAAAAICQKSGEQAALPLSGRQLFDENAAVRAAVLVEEARRSVDMNVNGVLLLSVLFLQLRAEVRPR